MINKKKIKCVVTGGRGFIGSHLTKRLLKEGRNVVVVDMPDYDLTDYRQAFQALGGVDIVFHLACDKGGLKYLHGSQESELRAWQINSVIDSNVFKVCKERKIERIIYPSSSAVYPLDNQYKLGTVFKEDDKSINPEGGYGWVKYMGEIQLKWMQNTRVAIPRFFNIYGENEPSGERAHAIYDLIRKAIRYPNEKFIVWGNGEQTRDYLYISDCIDVLIMLMERSEDFILANFGSGRATTISEVAETVIKISEKDIKPIYDLDQPVGPISRTADITKAKEIFNWQPKVSLEDGLKKTYQWVEKELK